MEALVVVTRVTAPGTGRPYELMVILLAIGGFWLRKVVKVEV